MARFQDHKRALALRQQGKSYTQIKEVLKVSKSTLSIWLREYPLSDQRIRELRDWSEQRIEKYRETRKKQKERRLEKICKEQKNDISDLNKRELYLAGLFLYWGEGTKSTSGMLNVSNTDPSVIKFFKYWFMKTLGIPKNKLKVQLHLYNDMDINKEIKFWSNTLNIPCVQFTKPSIKNTQLKNISYKRGFGHGTCNLRVSNTRLTEQVLMALKVLANKYNEMGE